MKLAITSISLFTCCLAQVPRAQQSQPTVIQKSGGACSPNIFGVGGNLTLQCGNDPQAFENVVREYMNAIRERDKAEADRRLLNEQLARQERLSSADRQQTQESLALKDAELAVRTREAEEWAAKYRQLADELKLSEEAKASTLRRLQSETQRASALALSAAAGLLDANPEEHRRAVMVSLQAMWDGFSYTTASSALRELLSLSGPTVNRAASVGFSADGTKIVAVTRAHELHLWDVATGRLLRTVVGDGPLASFQGVLKPRSSDVILTFTSSGNVSVWSCSTLNLITVFQVPGISEHGHWAKSASGDGSTLAEAFQLGLEKSTPVNVWDVKSGRKVETLAPRTRVSDLAVSEHGAIVASMSSATTRGGGTITLWKAKGARRLREYQTNGVSEIMAGLGDQIFGVVQGKKSKEIWELTTGKRMQVELPVNGSDEVEIGLAYPNFVWSLSVRGVWLLRIGERRALLHVPAIPRSLGVDPSGRWAMISLADATTLFNLESREYHSVSNAFVGGPVFSLLGDLVVAGTKTGIAAWRTSDGAPIWDRHFRGSSYASAFARSAPVARIEGGYPDHLGDSQRGNGSITKDLQFVNQWVVRRSRKDEYAVSASTFSNNGHFFVRCSRVEQCQVFEYETMNTVGRYGIETKESPAYTLVSDDGRSVLMIDQKELRLLSDSAATPKVVLPLLGGVSAVSATGNFHFVAVAHRDGTVELIDIETGARNAMLGNGATIKTLDFSDDGGLLAGGATDGSIVLWAVPSRTRQRTFQLQQPVTCVRLSREGRLLAAGTGSDDGASRGTVKLWDTEHLLPITEFSMFMSVRAIGFSEDEQSLMADDGGGPIQAPFTRDSLGRALCRLLVPTPNSGLLEDAQSAVKNICATLEPK
jgi:WD40 repeat protein